MEEFNNNVQQIKLLTEQELDKKLEQFYQRIIAAKTQQSEFVDEKVALKTLGLRSKTSLWKLRSEGKIAYSKMGKIIMYRFNSLLDYIRQNEQQTF